ncbi:MAG TPA: TetR/AcrR family transcriptional regulator [Polyangiaceae bacterium]
MTKPTKPSISARKRPSQARSTEIVETILEAALRVLNRDGSAKLTTVRVAEEAGVSVGSLYQYFPNKVALLFRLQADEWQDTWQLVEEILSDEAQSPRERLERAVVTFFRSEKQERAIRAALDDAGAPYNDSPEAAALEARANDSVARFVVRLAPHLPENDRPFVARFFMTTMGALAEEITTGEIDRTELDAWARECAAMLTSWLDARGKS